MRFVSILAATAAFWAASAADATIIADFELNGSLANSAGTAATLVNNAGAGSLGATGITFGANVGPTILGLAPTSIYTIDMTFTLDSIGGYKKLVDFSSLASDAGFYDLNGQFSIYPLGNTNTTPGPFAAGTSVRLTLSRDAAGNVAGYVNDLLLFGALDPTNQSATTITGALNFFIDDFATGQREATSGFVDYIRIYDTAITPGQAVPVPPVTGAVPEPASWAMMIGGLGMVGGAMRRRRTMVARTA